MKKTQENLKLKLTKQEFKITESILIDEGPLYPGTTLTSDLDADMLIWTLEDHIEEIEYVNNGADIEDDNMFHLAVCMGDIDPCAEKQTAHMERRILNKIKKLVKGKQNAKIDIVAEE